MPPLPLLHATAAGAPRNTPVGIARCNRHVIVAETSFRLEDCE
jgi:hypothetical protein